MSTITPFMWHIRHIKNSKYSLWEKLNRVALLVEGPYPANALTDADTNPISDTMVNIEFGSKDKFRKKTFLPNELLTTLFLEQHLAFHGSAKKNKPFFISWDFPCAHSANRENPPIWDLPLYITITFEPTMGFKKIYIIKNRHRSRIVKKNLPDATSNR